MVDGRGQIIVPSKEPAEVQNQECFLQRARGGGKGDKVRSCGNSGSSLKGRRVKIITSHSIVGESFTELIDHDEEDAQGIAKAILTKGNSVGVKHAPRWPTFTNEC